MTPLPAREAYGLWAPMYAEETAVSFLENAVVEGLRVTTRNVRLLDAGCGIARRLSAAEAALSVGVDSSAEMLAHANAPALLIAASVSALPFRTSQFDVVWCRLVLGHLPDISLAYRQLASACADGGSVVVTDFHADAVARGHRRTFRDESGTVREVEHYVHDAAAHGAAAEAAGLTLITQAAGTVGPAIRSFYERAAKLDVYEGQRGLSLILALVFRKGAP